MELAESNNNNIDNNIIIVIYYRVDIFVNSGTVHTIIIAKC